MPSLSPDEFRVALGDLGNATRYVRAESEHVANLIGQVQRHFEAAHGYWQSPSATTFEAMAIWLNNSSRVLLALLSISTPEVIIGRGAGGQLRGLRVELNRGLVIITMLRVLSLREQLNSFAPSFLWLRFRGTEQRSH